MLFLNYFLMQVIAVALRLRSSLRIDQFGTLVPAMPFLGLYIYILEKLLKFLSFGFNMMMSMMMLINKYHLAIVWQVLDVIPDNED